MHKSPLSETKQVEHVVNERRILGAADHAFCVRLLRAFQDTNELYLLQEWVGGEVQPCITPLPFPDPSLHAAAEHPSKGSPLDLLTVRLADSSYQASSMHSREI